MTAELGQIATGHVIDGKYRIVRLLGTGGMGAVYEGENMRIRRRVAIKMLHGGAASQADVVKRFEREAEAAGRVGSEHICEVYDLGQLPDGTLYMVMEYLEGETLSGRIRRVGRLTPAMSIPLMLQVLEGLGAAHAAGIIHRDLKPDNIFILPLRSGVRDFVKIIDFGVSKFSQLGGEEMNVTRAGAVVGTPYYMSPEQARGTSAVDARSDTYAMGVLLYQATTNQVPFQAETFNDLLFKIVLDVAPPPQLYVPDLDPEFAGLILKAMARDPDQRFQSCAEFAAALYAYQAARATGYPPAPVAGAPGQRPPATQVLPVMDMPAPGQAGDSASRPSWSGNPILPPTQPMSASPIHASNATWANPVAAALGAPVAQVAPVAFGAPGPDAVAPTTGNSWGNASAVAVPRSKAPMVAGIVGAVVVLGGLAVGAALLLGKKPHPTQAGGGDRAQPIAALSAPSPTLASAAPLASAIDTMAPLAETPAPSGSVKVGAPAPSGSAKAGASKLTGKLPPAPSGKPGKPGKPGTDLGY